MRTFQTIEDSDVIYTLVTRTAARRGIGPHEVDPLADVIDPELVVAFATSEAVKPEAELRFEFNGCDVRVDGTGSITIQDAA